MVHHPPPRTPSIRFWVAVGLVLFALSACADTLSGPELLGTWGGEGIQLVLEPSGGTMEFDCAAGTMDVPLIPRKDGSFTVQGTWTRGHGGPAREGEEPEVLATIWSGDIEGKRMAIAGRVLAEDLILGPYQLFKDADGLLRRCL